MFSSGPQGQTYFYMVLRPYMPSSLSLSYGYTVEFSKGYMMCDDVVALKVNGMCDYIHLCFKFFSVLSVNKLNTDRYNPHKTKALCGLQ